MIYSVIVDVSASEVDKIFHYKGENYQIGTRVLVNFANRFIEGFIVDEQQTTDCPPEKLKEIVKPLDDFPAISADLLELGAFMKKEYNLRWVDVLRLFIPAEMRKNRVKPLTKRCAQLIPDRTLNQLLSSLKPNALRQKDLVNFLFVNGATFTDQLNDRFGAAALKSLEQKGLVQIYGVEVRRTPYKQMVLSAPQKRVLTDVQQSAVDAILSGKDGRRFLLHGVTGSGKTEVYLTVIEQIVSQGKTAIMLVPEISLTPNMLRQLRERFGNAVALLHSGLSVGERYDEWLRLKTGEAKIAVGARSAVFAPLANIGAIIIDEEHDSSYVSDFNPRYDTLSVAKFRAAQNGAVLVLGSATPSLDSFYEAKHGGLQLISMPERINKQPLPNVEIVDMRKEVADGHKGIFSRLLQQRLAETIKNGNQAMIFLNRRGYSSFLMCTKCGYVAKCSDCDVSLTVHREDNMLKCHYCGKKYYMLTKCPECHEDSFRQGRIGTQQIVQMLNQAYPDVKVLRMDADTTQTKESHGKILEAFAREDAQILVGTQMIAKGHDFPKVTLVCILDGDQSLHHDDYLASERTFQLLTQVAGRSGRNRETGTVVLQTYTPEHYCLKLAANQDYLGFYRHEINLREAAGFPPFTEIVRILYQGENEQDCIDELTVQFADFANLKSQYPNVFFYLDKMRCPLKRAEKKYRFQALMKLDKSACDEIIPKIYYICNNRKNMDVSVFAERNPQNLT
ncbi:MAG: primosomal protein N' [Corallococcus sp.]|nr:primosomal protein N' [Corallococcus sp.]MCM1359146.1 primosomal protein N' [Corallococcus sp.]MCM1394536.1 primosomal protein N' [Corallococcus sp.]